MQFHTDAYCSCYSSCARTRTDATFLADVYQRLVDGSDWYLWSPTKVCDSGSPFGTWYAHGGGGGGSVAAPQALTKEEAAATGIAYQPAPQPTPFGHNWRRGKQCIRKANYRKRSKHYELPKTL